MSEVFAYRKSFKRLPNFSFHISLHKSVALLFFPGCIPCKTYAEGTPIPKLSYARYFQGKRAVKNLSTDDFEKLRVLAQILTFS